jgi:superfamily II DNA or RNA helicase
VPADPPTLDPLDIDSLASPRIVRRGRGYARKGHVLEWRVAERRLMAKVQGVQQEPYLVSIDWDGEELLPECTCPFEDEPFCKHAVAALVMAAGGPMAESEEADHGEWVPPALPRRAEEVAARRTRGRRAARDDLSVRSLDGERYFGRFEVVPGEGRGYRVEIRSFRHLHNWCSCPDFAGNLLGTCKHIEAVLWRLRKRAPKKTLRLASAPPPVSYVFVRRVEEPRLWLERGREETPRLAAFLARWFDATGAFRGDPAADFAAFRREAEAREGLWLCEDALEFAALAARDRENGERRARVAERILAHRRHLPGVDAELYAYQTEGVAFLAGTGRALLGDDMGLGKTLQAIAACRWLRDRDGAERTLVVCPASLKHQWAREIERFAGQHAVVVQGGVPERRIQYRQRAPFTIANYELVLRDGARVRELDPDVLILDEAQRIKNWRTKTAEAIKAIRTRFAFVLTGTPIENRLDDLYSLMQVVDRRILGPLWAFNERFVDLSPKGNRILGYRNLDRLREVLRPVFLRRDRATVLSQLPERVDNRYYVELTPVQRELMEEYWQQALIIAVRAEKRPLTPAEIKRMMACFQMARMACDAAGLVDKESEGSPKLDEFARVLREVCLESGRKVVVFSEWEGMIRLAARRAERLGVEHVILSGSVPTKKRGALIDRFREDPEVLAFFSTDAGGVGLNLQAAQTVINLDLPWNPARLEQRIARVHRLGQPRSVNVVLLIAEDSIEEHIEGVLASKRDLFRAALGGAGEPDALETSPQSLGIVREILEKPVERAAPAEESPPARAEEPAPPAPEPEEPEGEDLLDRLRASLGYRLLEVRRTRSGRLTAVVDRMDEEAARTARDAAGKRVVVLDRETLAAFEAFGEDSPLAGAETVYSRSAEEEDSERARELLRIARRRLKAATTLAESGMGAEALAQAHGALLACLRARLPAESDAEDADALTRALYDMLLPEGKATIEEAGTLSRIGDLARIYGDRDAEPPGPLVRQCLEEAARAIEA